jgi:hypothetical protein
VTDVTYLRLLRSIRLMVTMLDASLSACFCSAASALAAFLAASLAARSCAATEREAVAAVRASVVRGETGGWLVMGGWKGRWGGEEGMG